MPSAIFMLELCIIIYVATVGNKKTVITAYLAGLRAIRHIEIYR